MFHYHTSLPTGSPQSYSPSRTDAMEAGPVMSIVVDIIVRHTSSVKTRSILTAERLKELRLRVSPYCATVMPKTHGMSIIVAQKLTGLQATHSRYWALATLKTHGTSIMTVARSRVLLPIALTSYPIGMPKTHGMYILTERKSTEPPLTVSRCFVTATPRIDGTCISTR